MIDAEKKRLEDAYTLAYDKLTNAWLSPEPLHIKKGDLVNAWVEFNAASKQLKDYTNGK